MAIKSGEASSANEVMNALGQLFKNQTILMEDAALAETNLKQTEVDTFGSDTSDTWQHMHLDAGSWKTRNQDTSFGDSSVDIYCTSLTSGDFAINNCQITQLNKTATTQIWRLYCDTGTAEVQRAQIIKTLFYGTDGTNDRASGSITGLTNLKSSDARDVGKRAIYAKIVGTTTADSKNAQYTGTFQDTATNTDCSSWSKIAVAVGGDASDNSDCRWELPEGTTLNNAQTTGTTPATSDELGTDTSADEGTNPADCELDWYLADGNFAEATTTSEALILCKGAISWAETDPDNIITSTNNDSFVDDSVPVFEAQNLAETAFVSIVLNATTGSTITNLIPTWLSTIDASNSLAVTISADGTNYENITDATINRPIDTGTNLKIKFTITRTDNTTVDTIDYTAVTWNLY